MAEIVSAVAAHSSPSAVPASAEPTAPAVTPAAPPAPAASTPPAPKEGAAFAAMKKQERALQATRDTAKREREEGLAAIAAERAKLDADIKAAQEYAQAKANAKRVPLKALEALGLTYEDLTQAQLNGSVTTPDLLAQDVDEKLASLEKKLLGEREAEKAAAAEASKKEEDAVVARFHQSTADWVKAEAEKYELLNHYGQQDQVGLYIEQMWNQHAKEITRVEAAEALEKYLQGEAEKVLSTKWYSSRGKAPAAPAPKVPPTASGPAVPESDEDVVSRMRSTLTNSMTRTTAAIPEKGSFQERLAAAKGLIEPK